MAGSQAIYEGGLADPVFGSQAVFKKVMDAMANPGRIIDLSGTVTAPAPLTEASAAFLAALADYDTPVWFEGGGAEEAAGWLAFHAGAPVADEAGSAAFVLLAPGSPVAGWSRFAIGTSSYPDRSATLLLPVESFTDGPALLLAGPGIETTVSMTVEGLPTGFAQTMAGNTSRFPLGFDVILICGSQVLALPRTIRITEA